MKIRLSKEEVMKIVEIHLKESQGFYIGKLEIIYEDKEEYEYFGDPTRQDRRKINVRRFIGIETDVLLENPKQKGVSENVKC